MILPAEKISQYFTWGEAIGSSTAERLEIDNTPPDNATIARIVETARRMDSIRRFLGVPVYVTSWYRCPRLNAAIGSKPTSQHLRGEAVDFRAPQFGTPTKVCGAIIAGGLHFDQLILEYPGAPSGGWVHCSFTVDRPQRQQALLIDASGTMALA